MTEPSAATSPSAESPATAHPRATTSPATQTRTDADAASAAQQSPAPAQQSRALAQQSPALLPNRTALLLGLALALSATDPSKLGQRNPVGWLLTVAVLVGAIWAAPVVARRPASTSVHWTGQLVRHRNTVFGVACVIIAGFGNPPVWEMVVDAALLLAYLLTVDALAAGPIGIRQLHRGVIPAAAAVASAVALLAAHAPVDSGAVWGRAVAAVAVAAAAIAAGAAVWIRQHEARQREIPQPETRQQRRH